MSLLKSIKKISAKRMMKVDALFTFPIEKQIEFLNSLSEPKDDLNRSYLQYKCQIKRIPKVDFFIQNIGSIILLILYWFKIPRKNLDVNICNVDAIFFQNGISDSILPQSLINKYKNIVYKNYDDALLLIKQDRKFIIKIWKKYPLDFYFLLKIMIKIAAYRAEIEKFNPKEIIVSAEYSFTSSILTEYVESMNIIHTNVMHGEKLFTISDSFFRFTQCYVWDKHYVTLFKSLRVPVNQFKIEIPKALKFSKQNVKKSYYLKYYLSDENENDLKKIAFLFKKIQKKGYRVAIRPHPRFSDEKLIKTIFKEIELEDKSVGIEESILSCEYVCALFSTVLNQAYFNGIKIVIDDYSNQEKYIKLKKMNYLMFNKEHKVLSQFLNI